MQLLKLYVPSPPFFYFLLMLRIIKNFIKLNLENCTSVHVLLLQLRPN